MSSRAGIRWTQGDPGAVAAALDEAAQGVQDAVARVVREAPDALRRAFPDEARASLPRRGGFAELVAAADLAVVEDVAGETVSVVVTASSGRVSLGPINAGDLRHPTYGRAPWQSQRVRPGVWQRACDTAAEGTPDELLQDLRTVNSEAARSSS